jgi:hypothetical protein
MSKSQVAIVVSASVLLLALAAGLIVRTQSTGDTSAAVLPTWTPPPPAGFPPGTIRPTGTVVGTPANLLTPKGQPTPPSGPPATPGPNGIDREGSQAIVPTIQTSDPAVPAFTAQDATAYALAHPEGLKVDVSGPVTVASVQFLTESQLAAQNMGIGVAPTRLICVVELHGSFIVGGPPPLALNPTPLPSRSVAREYFDAHTGNLLVYAVP